MQTHFSFIVALAFLFTSSAMGAATLDRLESACAGVQHSSSRLNKLARKLSVETAVGLASVTPFSSKIPWMETEDKCDPGNLRKDPKPCISKVSAVLRSYRSEVQKVGELQVCSRFTAQIEKVLQEFDSDMRRCARATRALHLPEFSVAAADPQQIQEDDMWEADAMCHYVMERIFSFSVLAARVFALGDPARHDHHVPAGPCA
ncbi:unnamed protein product [Merluccius merluccius]